MTRDEIASVTPEEEMLARMWIKCDPNRGGGEGMEPDDLATLHVDGTAEQHPRWMWFIPRARSSIQFMEQRGYRLERA